MLITVHCHTSIADTKNDILEEYYPYYVASMNRIGKERGWSPYSQTQFVHGMESDGALFMGSANDVADKIITTIERFGLTRFVAHIDVGEPTHSQIMRTIEMYGEKVIPMVKNYFQEKGK